MDVEDLIAIARVQSEGQRAEDEDGESADEQKRRRRARKSRDPEVQDEERGQQLSGENGEGANSGHVEDDTEGPTPNRLEGVQKTTNFSLDGAFDDREYAEKPKRSRKSNGTSRKRKHKSGDSDDMFYDMTGEGTEGEGAALAETKSGKNRGRNTRSRKSQNVGMEEETMDMNANQSALPELEEEQVPADFAELPKKLRRAKKNAKISPPKTLDDIVGATVEDDNNSSAALHRPLTPAHMGHQRTSSCLHEEAAAQVQNDSQSSGPFAPEDELQMTPNKPSKKALGKRKAVDVEASVSKRQKSREETKAAGTPELE